MLQKVTLSHLVLDMLQLSDITKLHDMQRHQLLLFINVIDF